MSRSHVQLWELDWAQSTVGAGAVHSVFWQQASLRYWSECLNPVFLSSDVPAIRNASSWEQAWRRGPYCMQMAGWHHRCNAGIWAIPLGDGRLWGTRHAINESFWMGDYLTPQNSYLPLSSEYLSCSSHLISAMKLKTLRKEKFDQPDSS